MLALGTGAVVAAGASLMLTFQNAIQGPNSNNVKAYVQGGDPVTGKQVFLGPNNQLYAPCDYIDRANSSNQPLDLAAIELPVGAPGAETSFTLPHELSSGRVYFSEGSLQFFMTQNCGLVQPSVENTADPNYESHFGWAEMTVGSDGELWINPTYIDFAGLATGITMQCQGQCQANPNSNGELQSNAVQQICNKLEDQNRQDGFGWDKLCIRDSAGNPVRALGVEHYASVAASSKLGSVYEDTGYISNVWSMYTNNVLTINTQDANVGNATCQVQGEQLVCTSTAGQTSETFGKPRTNDIWGCASGPFTNAGSPLRMLIAPRLCAAFQRSTLLLPDGDLQPTVRHDDYYKDPASNHYSRIVHELEIDGTGYAFPYDDVGHVRNRGRSGLMKVSKPIKLTLKIG